MIPAMQEVGERFERHEFFVPEMLIAARAMQGGLKLLRPLLAQTFPLRELGKAQRAFLQKKHVGNIVVET